MNIKKLHKNKYVQIAAVAIVSIGVARFAAKSGFAARIPVIGGYIQQALSFVA